MCDMVLSEEWKTDPYKLLHDFAYNVVGVFISGYDVKATLANTPVVDDRFIRQWTWQYCTEWGFF